MSLFTLRKTADGGSGQQALAAHLGFIQDIAMIDGKATARVCKGHVCQFPTNDLPTLAKILSRNDSWHVCFAGCGKER